ETRPARDVQRVPDFNRGRTRAPSDLTDLGGTLFFSATDGTNGFELWRSDGTAGGTQLVKDINPGPGSSVPFNLTDFGGSLLFSATDGTNGYELSRSDPPFTDAQMVKDIRPGPGGSYPNYLNDIAGGTPLFHANHRT